MLVWLDIAYSRPLLEFFWGTFPLNDVTHCPNPSKDHPWSEPRHLCHKLQIFSYFIIEWALEFSISHYGPPEIGFWVFFNMVG